MTAEMALGPAMSGMAIGKMKGSASTSSSSILFFGKSMPRAITKSTIPPEMLREWEVRLSASRRVCPTSAERSRIKEAKRDSRSKIF